MSGIVPHAAYRQFDRDAFVAAVSDAAVDQLARRMAEKMTRVRARHGTPSGALRRLRRQHHVPAASDGNMTPLDHLAAATRVRR